VNHADHVGLLRGGIPAPGGRWADLGSGAGAFTLALADLLGPGAEVISVDRDRGALRAQESAMRARFPAVTARYLVADFTRPLDLPPLDGVVMANALHFVPPKDKEAVLGLIEGYLRPGGRFIIVEYNADRGNPWVPHPISYRSWEDLSRRAGFRDTRLLATVPSRFLGEIYAAVSLR
jgi:SAM-dependent methyltransferase